MKPKIYLTGASGFLARNILEELGNKYRFVAPSHKQLDLTNSNEVENFFKKNKYFDYVIHTAIVGGNRKIPNNAEIATTNLKMFFNVARCETYFGKMFHLGSGVEYGKERTLRKVKEDDFNKFVPQDNYGFYKYLCGEYIESTDKIMNLRLFGIFGKYEDATIRFISNAICKSILGMPITIHQNVYFDYLYAPDFVKIVDYFLNNSVKHHSYNVGSGVRIDLRTIADKINKQSFSANKISDEKLPIKISLGGLGNEYTCSIERLKSELGNFQFTDLDNAIEELYGWYYAQKGRLRKKDFLDDHFN